jgi:hypothetical protein
MNRLLLVFILCALIGCKEISFREPQPKGKKSLTQIPKKLQGRYLTIADNGEFSKDTVVITSSGYKIGYFNVSDKAEAEKNRYDSGVIGDSLVMKSFKGYYFLNFREKPEWLLRVLKQEDNGDIVYMSPEQSGVDFSVYIRKLAKEIKIDSTELEGKMLYQINPSPNELVALIEKGFFSRSLLKKIQ